MDIIAVAVDSFIGCIISMKIDAMVVNYGF